MKNYRLISNLVLFLVPKNDDYIFISDLESKQHQNLVKKCIQHKLDTSEYTDPIELYNNEFEISLTNTLDIRIKSENLPNPEKWYILGNFSKNFSILGEIITSIKSDLGFFGNTKFEIAINDKTEEVELVCPGMPSYSDYMEEMKRRINCEIYKKTKKWIPGHRYDTIKETIYYLGPVMSRRTDRHNSEWVSDDKMTEAYLITNKIGSEKTISDILRTRSFGTDPEDLKIISSISPMVDSGEVLADDYNYNDFQEIIYNNSLKKHTSIDGFGKINYNISNILDPLGYTGVDNKNPDLTKYKSDIEKIINSEILDLLVRYWDSPYNNRPDRMLSDNLDQETNNNNCKKILLSNIKDSNIMKSLYYPEIFKLIGIDLSELVKQKINNWDIKKFINNFENYLKYGMIYNSGHPTSSNPPEKTTRLRTKKSCNFDLELPIEGIIDNSTELYSTILEMINSAKENHGLGVSYYSITNIGTAKLPKEFITVTITLNDILKTFKTPLEIPENLKNDIVRYNFQLLTLTADKDIDIK